MLSLELRTDDPSLVALADAYWALTDDGKWEFGTAVIEERFGIKRGLLSQEVSKACSARTATHACGLCKAAFRVASRSNFEEVRRAARSAAAAGLVHGLVCRGCAEEQERQQHAAAQVALRDAQQRISTWLHSLSVDHPKPSYASISLREAFLIDGLLRYAGDAWSQDGLAAWTHDKPRLCDNEEDIRSVFKELHGAGWLTLSPRSPFDAFEFTAGGEITMDFMRVEWTVAADKDGLARSSLLEIAQSIQSQATAVELRPIWEWVCMCEMKVHFAFCRTKWRFNGRAWTESMQESVLRLLEESPLGVAKTVMYKCFKHLASELQQGTRPAAHIYNMLPGSLQRTADYYRARGWSITPWRPLSRSIYSHHLFNPVMGGGEECHDKCSGISLTALGDGRPTGSSSGG